ncbi:MAG: hypothetical protein WAM81_06815 [Acidimicrobiia bacterium]
MKRVEVVRSALRVWLLSLAGIVFALMGLDVLSSGRFVSAFGKLIYGTEQIPTFEPRDRIFALLAVVGGLVLIVWGLRDLVAPRKLVSAGEDGLRLAVGGPLAKATLIPWSEVTDISSEVIDDDGQLIRALLVQVEDPSRLPSDPWSARWVGSHTLMIEAINWSRPVEGVATDLLTLREAATVHDEAMPWE